LGELGVWKGILPQFQGLEPFQNKETLKRLERIGLLEEGCPRFINFLCWGKPKPREFLKLRVGIWRNSGKRPLFRTGKGIWLFFHRKFSPFQLGDFFNPGASKVLLGAGEPFRNWAPTFNLGGRNFGRNWGGIFKELLGLFSKCVGPLLLGDTFWTFSTLIP